MKRLLLLLCLLLIGGAIAVCAIGVSISSKQDAVTLTPHPLYGDPAAAEGATVELLAHLKEHLRWDVTYPIGGEAETDYRFSMRRMTVDRDADFLGIQMYEDFEYGLDIRAAFSDLVGLEVAYYELFRDTAPGTKGTATVRLQDYYTYYPIRIDIDLPGTLWHGIDYEDLASDDYINERVVWDAFRTFFRIPIPEDLPAIEISVTKNVDGSIGGTGSSGHGVDGSYSLWSEAAYTSNVCYLTINNRYGDSYVDTSLIPGGYGIYRFDYENVRNEKNTQGNSTIFHPGYETGVDEKSLCMVYPLAQSEHVNAMHITPDERRMLLLSEDREGAVTLTVIDLATMEAIQRIPVTEQVWVSLHQEEDFFVLFFGQMISVYSLGEDGHYAHVLTAPQPNYINEEFSAINTHAAVDFDGESVIFVDLLDEHRYRALQTSDLCVAVYKAEGLCYYGEYDNSLAANPHTSDYAYNVHPIEVEVQWES